MSNAHNRKRQAEAHSDDESESGVPATPGGGMIFGSSPPPTRRAGSSRLQLPPSSPPAFIGDYDLDEEDDTDLPGRLEDAEDLEAEGELLALEDEDDEGEDLFGPAMARDYQ
ncbi:hypothetical protein IW146_010366, partial [Coemansia sp. RSA 922]